MTEMVAPSLGYEIAERADCTELRCRKANGAEESILIYRDHVTVGGKNYAKVHIHSIDTKKPDFVERQERHTPRPPRGIFGALGAMVGASVVKSQIEDANNTAWAVVFAYGDSQYPLIEDVCKERAHSIKAIFARLIHSP